ncbi:MAG: dihydrolipoyl dehydrogenase [Holosporales bacterium]
MATYDFDLAVIGAGPGGYVAAIKAAQLGLRVVCINKTAALGGTCLHVGCIPSKALLVSSHKYHEAQHGLAHHGIQVKGVGLDLKTMMARKDKVVSDNAKGIDFLFKKNGVSFQQGTASFVDAHHLKIVDDKGAETHISAGHILIATGSEPASLPGVEIDEAQIVSSTGALNLSRVPKHLVVIGGGYIGLELGSVWARLGAEVTVVEYAPSIVPAMDHELSAALAKQLQAQGLRLLTNTKVLTVLRAKGQVQVALEPVTPGQGETQTLVADVVLCAAGRKPMTQNLHLDQAGLSVDARGFIEVDDHCQTTIPHIYAIGDCVRGPMLAHKAEEEGVCVVERIAGQKPHINYGLIPGVIYTHPEVACLGRSEQELKQQGVSYKVGKFPFSANGRARANGESEGFVKILSDAATDEVLGVHIIHAEAGTMIAEAAIAMEYRASAEDIARTCHAHPTVSEALKEAALAAWTKAIHM